MNSSADVALWPLVNVPIRDGQRPRRARTYSLSLPSTSSQLIMLPWHYVWQLLIPLSHLIWPLMLNARARKHRHLLAQILFFNLVLYLFILLPDCRAYMIITGCCKLLYRCVSHTSSQPLHYSLFYRQLKYGCLCNVSNYCLMVMYCTLIC